MKLAAVEAAAVAAEAAAEAAGPGEGQESETTQKLSPTSLTSRHHPHLGMKKPSRFFTAALAVERISRAPASSRAVGCVCSTPAK